MDSDAINSLTKKWTANLVYCFEDFDNETHSQRLSAYIDQKPLDKFKEANLIELNKERDRWKLTNKGIDLLESIKNIYQSGRIFPLPLPFRHYYVNCKLEYNMEVKDGNVYDGLRETVLKDRSRDVRRKVAEYLEYKGKLNYKTATSLAKDKDPELRKLAAKHTVASLYWEETDYDVIRYMVENKLADRLCFEHWVKSDDETIRALSAPLAEETDIDPLLDSLSDESAIQVLFNNPEWVKGKRAVRLWRRMGGENRRWIMSFMWDVPDSLIEESLAEPRNWRISSRLEEYKKALQTVARMERLFAKGSEIKRKMRARAGLSD